MFLENRAGAQQPCQHVSTHAVTQSTHFCSSKSVLTSELARCQPGLTQGHLPAPPTPKAHFWGPWKCPPLSGPQVLGVGPHGGKNAAGGDEPGEPAALVVTSNTWPSLALCGLPGPLWPSLALPGTLLRSDTLSLSKTASRGRDGETVEGGLPSSRPGEWDGPVTHRECVLNPSPAVGKEGAERPCSRWEGELPETQGGRAGAPPTSAPAAQSAQIRRGQMGRLGGFLEEAP